MDTTLEARLRASAADREIWRPVFYRLADADDRAALTELLERTPGIRVNDELHAQLRELVRALNPAVKWGPGELDEAARAHLGRIPAEHYGVWVHYPWSDRLVHLLDEAEFVRVRTDRNRNKITAEEQALLATKKVGIIGLSVGQSAGLALAMERSFGELRLADFDTLDLSNLNRIRSGVHHLGVNKVVNTAREIAEIDPFLRLTPFTEGINADNIERFLTDGGKLDLLVEECDSVAVKIIARQHAKAHRIPVVMDTSDRGLIDVERFDLEPDRPILHGLVDHLDLALAAKARTNEEKLPFVIPIIGLETMSSRMKASMLEIENTVTTWPQLATAVLMGGAIVAHAGRRILLGQTLPSGRWWIDPDDSFGVRRTDETDPGHDERISEGKCITVDAMEAAAGQIATAPRAVPLDDVEARRIAAAGILAPTGGNCQPWRFLHHDGRLMLFLDKERAASALDPGWRYAMLGMGACVENMLLQAAADGIHLDHRFAPLDHVPDLIAVLERSQCRTAQTTAPEDLELQGQLLERCTNRRFSESLEITDREFLELDRAACGRFPLISLNVVRERDRIERISQLCGRAERIRFLNPTCHRDMFVKEMRWNSHDVHSTRDGIDIETLELSITDRTGLRVAADPMAIRMLKFWGTGGAIERLSAKPVTASSALAIFSMPDMSLASAYMTGRAMERFWLKATALGLLAHPVGAPIFMGIHGLWDTHGIMNRQEHDEAGTILDELKSITGVTTAHPFFMLRLGKAGAPTARSLRRPLNDVFHSTTKVTA